MIIVRLSCVDDTFSTICSPTHGDTIQTRRWSILRRHHSVSHETTHSRKPVPLPGPSRRFPKRPIRAIRDGFRLAGRITPTQRSIKATFFDLSHRAGLMRRSIRSRRLLVCGNDMRAAGPPMVGASERVAWSPAHTSVATAIRVVALPMSVPRDGLSRRRYPRVWKVKYEESRMNNSITDQPWFLTHLSFLSPDASACGPIHLLQFNRDLFDPAIEFVVAFFVLLVTGVASSTPTSAVSSAENTNSVPVFNGLLPLPSKQVTDLKRGRIPVRHPHRRRTGVVL